MAKKEIGVDIDLSGNQLVNTRAENLNASPTPALVGRLLFNTTTGQLCIDTGSAIYALPTQSVGVLAANRISITDSGGLVTTDPNFTWNSAIQSLSVTSQQISPGVGTAWVTLQNAATGNPLHTIQIYSNGVIGIGSPAGVGDKLVINGKTRVLSGNFQVDVGNAIIGSSASPQAKLDLIGGDSTRPALYLQPQVQYSGTTIEGAVCNDSAKKALSEQQLIGNKILSGILLVSTTDSNTVTNTIVETIFTGTGYQFNIPANSLSIGKVLKYTLRGRYGTGNPAPNITFRTKLGAANVSVSPAFSLSATQTNQGFEVEMNIIPITLGITGTAKVLMSIRFTNGTGGSKNIIVPNVTNKTINTTIANNINFSFQWSAANALHTSTIEQSTLEILN